MSPIRLVAAALAVCLLLPACGKTHKLTDGSFAKIHPEMPLPEVVKILGKGVELTPGSKGGFSSGAAAAGIDLPSGGGGGPTLLEGITFASNHKVMEWEEGNRIVQMVFINDKMKVKKKNW